MPIPFETSSVAPRVEISPGVWLDGRRAIWLAEPRLLVIADLHWGYAASHRARGNLLPAWGDDQIELRLNALLGDYHPAEMLWLGDIVHAAEGSGRAEQFLHDGAIPTTVLAGNHDRHWGGTHATSAQRGSFFFHHGDVDRNVPPGCTEIVGHHHPAFHWTDGAGGRVKLPALVSSARRLILPAFSPWAAGTEWRADSNPDATIWAIAPTRIFAVAGREPRPLAV